jgi:hypothetical protein
MAGRQADDDTLTGGVMWPGSVGKRSWEGKEVGREKKLGGKRSWEGKEVGSEG